MTQNKKEGNFMKLQEFMDKNPELMKKAAECKDVQEFAEFAKENSVEIKPEGLKYAYGYVRSRYGSGELSEDALSGVAGGGQKSDSTFEVNSDQLYQNLNDPDKFLVKKK